MTRLSNEGRGINRNPPVSSCYIGPAAQIVLPPAVPVCLVSVIYAPPWIQEWLDLGFEDYEEIITGAKSAKHAAVADAAGKKSLE